MDLTVISVPLLLILRECVATSHFVVFFTERSIEIVLEVKFEITLVSGLLKIEIQTYNFVIFLLHGTDLNLEAFALAITIRMLLELLKILLIPRIRRSSAYLTNSAPSIALSGPTFSIL